MNLFRLLLVAVAVLIASETLLSAQPPRKRRPPPWYIEPTPETLRKVEQLFGTVHDVELSISVQPNISRLLRTKRPVHRISVTRPSVLGIVQHSPTEFELVGLRQGTTSVTIWYADEKTTEQFNRSDPPIAPDRVLRFRR